MSNLGVLHSLHAVIHPTALKCQPSVSAVFSVVRTRSLHTPALRELAALFRISWLDGSCGNDGYSSGLFDLFRLSHNVLVGASEYTLCFSVFPPPVDLLLFQEHIRVTAPTPCCPCQSAQDTPPLSALGSMLTLQTDHLRLPHPESLFSLPTRAGSTKFLFSVSSYT